MFVLVKGSSQNVCLCMIGTILFVAVMEFRTNEVLRSLWLLLHGSVITDINIIITDNDIVQPSNVSLPSSPLHPNLTWPTESGISEAEARQICQAPILQSPIFSLCSNFTTVSLDVITKSCMLDLQVRIVNLWARTIMYCWNSCNFKISPY